MRNKCTLILISATVTFLTSSIHSSEISFPNTKGATGCLLEQITDGEFSQYQFQGVSADAKWLSYNISEADEGPYYSHLMNLETGEEERLDSGFNNTGNFSSDNKTLVAAVFLENGKTDIVEFDRNSGETISIASHPASDWLPSYSPDQKSIVFNSFRAGNADLYLYDRSSQELTQLTENPRYEAHAEFSPDGSKILFHRMVGQSENGRYDFDLYSIDIDSGEQERLTQTPFEESYGSWAPDGKHFVFSSDFEENAEKHNLYIKLSGQDELVKLTDGDWKDSYAYWTRDGKYIYFNSDRSGITSVYRISMDGLGCKIGGAGV
jgi:Tol biopolymer transport system component